MINYIKKFGLWEYFLTFVGVLLISKQTYSYLTDSLEYKPLELFVFVAGVLLIAAPVFLVRKLKEYSNKITKK